MINRRILKLHFLTPSHYGQSGPSLLKCDSTIASDTIYSALIDANRNEAEKIISIFTKQTIVFSDMLPYVEDNFLLPFFVKEEIIPSDLEEITKLVHFRPYNTKDEILSKELLTSFLKLENQIGEFALQTKNAINRTNIEATPFLVSSFTFNSNAGLYLIVDYQDEDSFNFIRQKIEELGYVGIGGRRSSGYGKFEIAKELDYSFVFKDEKTDVKLLVSTAYPKDPDILNDSSITFNILKRSGFYNTKSSFNKKRDVFAIQSGMLTTKTFEGKYFDDLGKSTDKIYRFLYSMFVGV